MSHLTHEQVRFFRDVGYYKLGGILEPVDISLLRNFVRAETTAKQQGRLIQESGSAAVKLYGLYDRNPGLIHSLLTKPALLEPLQSLLGPSVVFVKNRHNHATVNNAEATKSEARLHRDILQPTRGLITAAVYLEDATVANGCTHVVPGSQNLPFVGVPQENGGGTWMDEHDEYAGLGEQALPVPMAAGSVLLFDGLAFHSVGQNRGDGTRASITLGFRAVDELDFTPDDTRQILVSGEQLYRGNDI